MSLWVRLAAVERIAFSARSRGDPARMQISVAMDSGGWHAFIVQ
jgi:hypothetical protein